MKNSARHNFAPVSWPVPAPMTFWFLLGEAAATANDCHIFLGSLSFDSNLKMNSPGFSVLSFW